MKEIRREYKQGKKKNFYLRENNGTFFFEKNNKGLWIYIESWNRKRSNRLYKS